MLVGFYHFSNSKSDQVFKSETSWWKNGFSLFANQLSISAVLLYSGVLHIEGISGMWLYWCAILIGGFVPFVFAPLWAKLNFITDNQFILFRFSGKGAKALHVFRAIYVGWFIVAFLVGLHLLTFLKVLVFFTGFDRTYALLGLSAILLILSFKNTFKTNIKLDVFQFILFSTIFIILLLLFIYMPYQTTEVEIHQPSSPLFPENKWILAIFFLVQTWSVHLFDGGGIESQRFFSTRDRSKVWKVAVLAIILGMAYKVLLVALNYLGMMKLGTPVHSDAETHILSYIRESVPQWFMPAVLIAFFSLFLTSFIGMLNWGASFLAIDVYKTYINKTPSEKQLGKASRGAILLILITGLITTYFSENLSTLMKFMFSISAGVAPVFVLRWFWFRINAWSQISAMLASGVFTLVYLYFLAGSELESGWIAASNLNSYALKLLFVTILTSATWIAVTFLTPRDDAETISIFAKTLNIGIGLKRNIVKAVLFGLFTLLILIFSMVALRGVL